MSLFVFIFISAKTVRKHLLLPREEKCFVLASSIQNWGEGQLGEGGPGERGEPDVPWWFGLGWGWWRRVCDPVTLLSLQSVCFIIF